MVFVSQVNRGDFLKLFFLFPNVGNLKKKFYSEYEEEAQYALAAQIKLLMDIPERIWTSVDSQQYLNATKLYLFARHIHTNLSLNEEIMNSYPVIERQWAAISHFYNSICQGNFTKFLIF